MGKGPRVIGLAGGIASGKSLAAQQFASLGCDVIDADRMVHEMLKRPDVVEQVRKLWGTEVLAAEGGVDRSKLAERAFSSRDELRQLTDIVHPTVCEDVERQVREMSGRDDLPAVVIDAALLLERGLDRLCDAVVFIDAPLEARCRRAQDERGWAPEEVERREGFQDSLKIKHQKADYILTNAGTPQDLLRQVQAAFSQIIESARMGLESSPKRQHSQHQESAPPKHHNSQDKH
jgi:dephospho-CoA kinase